jgi:hypothetical protein
MNRNFVGEHERKGPFGRPRYRWEDNIKIVLKERVCDGVKRIELIQDRFQWVVLVNTVINLKNGEFLDQLGDNQLLKKTYVS